MPGQQLRNGSEDAGNSALHWPRRSPREVVARGPREVPSPSHRLGARRHLERASAPHCPGSEALVGAADLGEREVRRDSFDRVLPTVRHVIPGDQPSSWGSRSESDRARNALVCEPNSWRSGVDRNLDCVPVRSHFDGVRIGGRRFQPDLVLLGPPKRQTGRTTARTFPHSRRSCQSALGSGRTRMRRHFTVRGWRVVMPLSAWTGRAMSFRLIPWT